MADGVFRIVNRYQRPNIPPPAVGHTDSFKLPLQQVLPPRQTDWPVPQRPIAYARAPQDWVAGSTWPLTQPMPSLPAALQYDWPNPRGPQPLVLDWIHTCTVISSLPPPDLTAQCRQLDWPNPTRARLPVVADWVGTSTTLLSAPLPNLTAQTRQLDWPNPPLGRPPLVRDWLQSGGQIVMPPVRPFDWPNPQQPRQLVKDWIYSASTFVPSPVLVQGARQLNWPNPTLARQGVVKDWIAPSTAQVTAPPPVIPMSRPRDWPVPRGAKPNQPLGWTQALVTFVVNPPRGAREMLANESGRVRYLKNEVARVRWLANLGKMR